MTGTWINIGTILIGSLLGLFFGARLPERVRSTVIVALGLFTLAMGMDLFLKGVQTPGENVLIPLVSLLCGALLGEWWRLEDRLTAIGAALEARVVGSSMHAGSFIRGFVSASLLFCIGPMTILGSLQDGLTGNYELLAIKAVLDGFAALALASTFGVGVIFSTLVVLIYQGGLSMAAIYFQNTLTEPMLVEMTVVGGILLLSLAIGTLLEIRQIRTTNLLPALILAPAIVLVLQLLQGF
ncbi:MAG: DUF554 domain-containing protein [Anaerolineales bacterium]|nr:MAG: DUF554 domain-containing protein [Anaerolineales bacterium]